jgi:predicted enzyme related to lactoylglutathione lyase
VTRNGESANAVGVFPGIVLDIPAPDIGSARRFYEQVFGWTFDAAPEHAEWPSFSDGVTRGSLFQGEGSDSWPLVALRVVNLDRKIDEVLAAGGSIAREKWTLAAGSGALVRDPSSNLFGLWQAAT